jgi:hypothetical protein
MPESSLRWRLQSPKQPVQKSLPLKCALEDSAPVNQTDAVYMTRVDNYVFLGDFYNMGNLSDVSFLLLLEKTSRRFGVQIESANFLKISLADLLSSISLCNHTGR